MGAISNIIMICCYKKRLSATKAGIIDEKSEICRCSLLSLTTKVGVNDDFFIFFRHLHSNDERNWHSKRIYLYFSS